MLERRKAASEVLSSLVILLIVSLLGTSLYSFSLSTMRYQQDNLNSEIRLETARAKENFKVIYFGWDGLGDDISTMILNYGQLDIKISDVYVNGQKTGTYLSGRMETIYTSKFGTLLFTSPVTINAGNNYEIVLVSERGVSYAIDWTT